MIRTRITDGRTGETARVTSRGQLVVSQLDFSKAYSGVAGTANVPVNLVAPKSSQAFIITGILLYANKKVRAGGATVTVYTANSDSSSTVVETIFTTEIPKYARRDLTSLNLIVDEGYWLNLVTDNDDIFATVMGYYVDA